MLPIFASSGAWLRLRKIQYGGRGFKLGSGAWASRVSLSLSFLAAWARGLLRVKCG